MQKLLRVFSALTILSGVAAFIYLLVIPGEGQSKGMNLSPFRLLSLTGILLVICAGAVLFFRFKSVEKAARLAERIEGFRPGVLLSFVLFTVSLTAWVAILHRETWTSLFSEALYIRLAPILLLGSLICLEAAIILVVPHLDREGIKGPARSVWITSLIVLLGFIVIAIIIYITKIGFTFDNVGLNWGPAGTPVTFAQVNLVLAIGFLLTFAIYIIGARMQGDPSRWLPLLDVGVFLALWGLAVLLWSNQTMSPSHFAPAVSAPNYEYYPYSDAAVFDKLSYHLISGIGFSDTLIRRPLYVGLLALFHKIGGVSYNGTVAVQILFLALIPSFIYLLTANLSNRLAGILAGGLLVLREANSIDLSGKIVTSHSKLLMSDLPATLGIVAFVYACILLLKKPKNDKWLLLIIGGILGLTALVRAQSLILLALILLFVAVPQKTRKPSLVSAGIVLLGLVLILLPWVWRNWNLTGRIMLGDPGEKTLIARNYSLDPSTYPPPLPGETVNDFSDRLSRQIISFVVEHPGDVAFFMSNHFLHSLATSAVYIAPVYSTDTPASLVSNYPFWDVWDGALTASTALSLIANLAILAFGIGLAQAEDKRAGWYPLMVFIVYQAGNAIARTSGWRFSLPADWILLVYYCIALSYIPSKIGASIKHNVSTDEDGSQPAKPNRVYPVVFLLLFSMGIALPLAERLIPERKLDSVTDAAKSALIEQKILTSDQLAKFLEQQNAVFVSGIALYPRYYRPDGNIYLADMPQDFKYLHFWLINEGNAQIVLPREKPPEFFPHASTVTVIGCRENGYISAWAVIRQIESGEEIVLEESLLSLNCP